MTAEAGEASIGCRNCGATLAGTQRFCGACGQRVTAGRLTLRDVLSWATTLAIIFAFIVLFAYLASP